MKLVLYSWVYEQASPSCNPPSDNLPLDWNKLCGIGYCNPAPIVIYSKNRQHEGAAGLFPYYSLLNHSCSPNVLPSSGNAESTPCALVTVTAFRNIEAGEELLINYSRQPHREHLKNVWNIECTCDDVAKEDTSNYVQFTS